MGDFFSTLSAYLWGWPMVILLLGTHLYLTIRLGFPQRKIFKGIKLSISKDEGAIGDVSQFSALATSLAATIGTGNIIGVAIAISMGGPGAVFWCWMTGVLGIATKYGESLLSVMYRTTNKDGEMCGGPMYVLERGLNMKFMGILFALFTALAAFGIGCTVQANAISTLFYDSWHIPLYVTGGVVAFLAGLVFFFGVQGIGKVCSALVPFMAVFYVFGCLFLLWQNSAYLGESLRLIVTSAFTPQAASGGFVGSTILIASRFGIARGLFSNESGLGSAPIVAAAAQTHHPVRQALVSSTATFWDTVVVCAITGLALVSSVLAYPDITGLESGLLTNQAFNKIPYIGSTLLSIGIFTFAFSTILGWGYYSQKAIEYLGGTRWILPYRFVFVVMIFVGSVLNLDVVWAAADCMNALMALPNLLSLLLLSGVIAHETKAYLYGKD